MAGVLSQLEAFVKNNWCALLVGALVLYYMYYNQGRSGMNKRGPVGQFLGEYVPYTETKEVTVGWNKNL